MRSLNFFPLTYHLCKVGDNTVSDLETQFDIIALNMRVNLPLLSQFFFRLHWITFKRIDLAIIKLTLSCIKNIVVRNIYAIKESLLIPFLPTSLPTPVTLI